MATYINRANYEWFLTLKNGKSFRIKQGINEHPELPEGLELKFPNLKVIKSDNQNGDRDKKNTILPYTTNETMGIADNIISTTDTRFLQQQLSEWKAFITFVSSYFKTRGVNNPLVVEIGVAFNAQQKFYEEILGAEYIGIDISDKTCTIKGDAHLPSTLNKLKTMLNGRQIDLLFIDGDHSYAGVKKDYQMYSPLTKHIIAFHDITTVYDNKPTDPVHVVEFWKELEKNDKENTHITFFHHNPNTKGIFAPGRQMGIGVLIKPDEESVVAPPDNSGMKVYTFAACKNEEKMLPYYLKHYENIADKIIICDGGSTDGSLAIMKAHPKVTIISDPQKKLDDAKLMEFRNNCYQKYKNEIDWAIVGDIDELLMVDRETLKKYKTEGITIPNVNGYQMISMDFPKDVSKQIYEQIHTGFADPKWLNKNMLFNPKVVTINYASGCHKCNPQGKVKYSNDTLNMLHFKCIGYEQFVNKSKKSALRLSDRNIRNGWGFQYKIHAAMTKQEFKDLLVHGKVFDKPDGSAGNMITFDNCGKIMFINSEDESRRIENITEQQLIKHYKKQHAEVSNKTINNTTIIIADRPNIISKPKTNLVVNCVVPTLGVREQVTDTIDTLLTSTYNNIKVAVIVQEHLKMANKLKALYAEDRRVNIIIEPKRLGWVKSVNNIAKMNGHLFALADDISVTRDTIEILVSEMDRLFPDSDGIVLPNLTFTMYKDRMGWAGSFPFVGNKFLNRFPGRQVLCPDYKAYCGDVELPDFANSIKKCVMIPEASIIHFERRTLRKEITAILTRKSGIPDMQEYFLRQAKGYLWGKDFNLLNNRRTDV